MATAAVISTCLFYLYFDPLAILETWARHATIGEVWPKPTQVTECGRDQSVAESIITLTAPKWFN